MGRLIRTENEIEGRFTEQWLVVEEDALDQWPAGPLAVVGRPAERIDGLERARGQARYTADIRLPGMLHTAIARSPHARERVRRLDLAAALAVPGVRAAIGPDDAEELTRETAYFGGPVAAVAAASIEQARAALDAIAVEWEQLEPLLDADEAVHRGELTEEPRSYERGDVDRAFGEADVVVEAEYRTQTVLHNALETHQAVCESRGDSLEAHVSTSRRSPTSPRSSPSSSTSPTLT